MLITLGPISWIAVASALSALIATVTVAKAKNTTPEDPMEDLTFRLRHPYRWIASHPTRAIMRAAARLR